MGAQRTQSLLVGGKGFHCVCTAIAIPLSGSQQGVRTQKGMTNQNNQSIEVDPNHREALNLLIQRFYCLVGVERILQFPIASKNANLMLALSIDCDVKLSDLSKIGKDIKSAMAKAGFDCHL